MENHYILTLSCPDKLGIVATISTCLANMQAFILESAQYSDFSTDRFFMRIVFEMRNPSFDEKKIQEKITPIANQFRMNHSLHLRSYRPKALIMVSKLSHCLNDILHRASTGSLAMEIPAVVSNHSDLKEMVSWHGIPFHHLPISSENKQVQEEKLLQLTKDLKIDFIILARYMQILSSKVCKKYSGKIINIHHSFLPSFKGAKPYHQAHERGVKLIGATAHYVTEKLDEGPIIDQETVRVTHNQLPKDLVALGCDIENVVLARAIKYQIEQRVLLNNHKTVIFT